MTHKGNKPRMLRFGEIEQYQTRRPELSFADILARDGQDVPSISRRKSSPELPSTPIPATRYVSQEFHDLEMAHVWRKAWQCALRGEDIPSAGDWDTYEIGDASILIVRTQSGEIAAYHNVCPHRGRRLYDGTGSGKRLTCRFHGLGWDLEGKVAVFPCRWDFGHLTDDDMVLRPVRVGTWGGFVFICLDPNGGSLSDFLGDLPDHFADWDLANRYKRVHIAKVVQCNWKVGVEAFMEAWHTLGTHPQILTRTGDLNTQYDVWPEQNFNRMVTPMWFSPHLSANLDDNIEAGAAIRAKVENIKRSRFIEETGLEEARDWPTTRFVDGYQYFLFPSLFPWAAETLPLVYRFRPNGNDPNSSLIEVMLLSPIPAGQPSPRGAKIRLLTEEETWNDAAAELSKSLALAFMQDQANMPEVQRGLQAHPDGRVQLATYQESRVRHLHMLLERYIGDALPDGA